VPQAQGWQVLQKEKDTTAIKTKLAESQKTLEQIEAKLQHHKTMMQQMSPSSKTDAGQDKLPKQ
jgi:glutaredoxin 2